MSKKNKLLLLIVCLNLIGTIVLYTKQLIIERDIKNLTRKVIFDEEEV